MDEIMKLKIAVPSKGRISDPAVKILEKAGLGLKDSTNRYRRDVCTCCRHP